MTRALFLLLAATALLAGAARADAAPDAKITGTVFYRERIALPADAVLRVRLELAAAPQMPARLITMITVPTEGRQIPLAFEVPYMAADIQPEKRYFIRVSVTAGDKTLWVSHTPSAVITMGAPTKVEIELQQAGAGRRVGAQVVAPVGSLAGNPWTLVALAETPAVPTPEGAPAGLVFDPMHGKLSGSTGCNRFMGSYATGDGAALKLDPNGMTLMACSDTAMKQEAALLEALRTTTAYRISGAKLELLAGERVVARFVADSGARPRSE